MTDETLPGAGPVDEPVVPLVERLQDEADQARNDGANDIAELLDEAARALDYLMEGGAGRSPAWVPARIFVRSAIISDEPFPEGPARRVEAGLHDCRTNRLGAVSVQASNGQMIGLRAAEFDVVAWRRNTA